MYEASLFNSSSASGILTSPRNAFFRSSFLVVGKLCAAVLVIASIVGCDTGTTDQMRNDLETLKVEVRELKQLRYDLESVEKDVAALRAAKGEPSKESNDPIQPAHWTPDESYLDDPFLGDKDSQLLVMEFTNYQCKPCRQFFHDSFAELKLQFFDTKKAKFILRDFLVETNAEAKNAAAFAHCAGEQGKYWPAHAALYDQMEFVDAGNLSAIQDKVVGVDQQKLAACLTSTRYDKEISADVADGERLGVKGAPGFFVGRKQPDGSYGGVFIRGAQPVAVIAGEIKKALNTPVHPG